MTEVGTGGVVVRRARLSRRFKREYKKLTDDLKSHVDKKLRDLFAKVRPPGLRFEKLQGYSKPAYYTIHVTGNYKISMEIEGDEALLRRVAPHDEIDRQP